MQIAFISDLHLSSTTPQKNRLFYRLLDSLVEQNYKSLYILGDFFDYWLGDDDLTPFHQEVISKFSHTTAKINIYFLHGNHDFAIGKDFAKQTGINLIEDMTTLYTGKHKILLSHGDTFCTLDLNYQKMKKIIRNPIIIFILRRLPLTWRYKIKTLMEKGSHQTSIKNPLPPETYNVVDTTIVKYVAQYGADTVINGHTHHPGKYEITTKHNKLINRYETPDWEDHHPGGYLSYNDGIFSFQEIK